MLFGRDGKGPRGCNVMALRIEHIPDSRPFLLQAAENAVFRTVALRVRGARAHNLKGAHCDAVQDRPTDGKPVTGKHAP